MVHTIPAAIEAGAKEFVSIRFHLYPHGECGVHEPTGKTVLFYLIPEPIEEILVAALCDKGFFFDGLRKENT